MDALCSWRGWSGSQDRSGQRVLAGRFEASGQRQDLGPAGAVGTQDFDDLGTVLRQGAGLVQSHGTDPARACSAAPPLNSTPERVAPPTAATTVTATDRAKRARGGGDQDQGRSAAQPTGIGVGRRS